MCIRDSENPRVEAAQDVFGQLELTGDLDLRTPTDDRRERPATDERITTPTVAALYGLEQETPVSYTHLDVYKRQVQGRDFWKPAVRARDPLRLRR